MSYSANVVCGVAFDRKFTEKSVMIATKLICEPHLQAIYTKKFLPKIPGIEILFKNNGLIEDTKKAKNLSDTLEVWGYQYNKSTKEICGGFMQNWKMHGLLWMQLGKLVHPNSTIRVMGEDGAFWRASFKGGKFQVKLLDKGINGNPFGGW